MHAVRVGLNLAPFIAVFEARRWDVPLCLDLLSAIEHENLTQDENERAAKSRN